MQEERRDATGVVSWLVTAGIFGGLGWALTGRRVRPRHLGGYGLLLIVAYVAGSFSGPYFRLVDAFGFQIRFDWACMAVAVGAFLGALRSHRQWRRHQRTHT